METNTVKKELTLTKLLDSSLGEHLKDAPKTVQEMFELLMISEHGNSQEFRERAYLAMNSIREASEIIKTNKPS